METSRKGLDLLKSISISVVLAMLNCGWLVLHLTKSSRRPLESFYCPSPIHPIIAVSPENFCMRHDSELYLKEQLPSTE